MQTRTCTKCGETKELDAFVKDRNQCKPCRAARIAKWFAENPEKKRARDAKWAANNPEKARAKRAKWATNNPEKARDTKAKWRANNPEKVRDTKTKWRANNPEKVRDTKTKWRAKLPPAYVALALRIPTEKLTPDLLEMKRQQILNHRALKALTSTLKDLDEKRTDPSGSSDRQPDDGRCTPHDPCNDSGTA